MLNNKLTTLILLFLCVLLPILIYFSLNKSYASPDNIDNTKQAKEISLTSTVASKAQTLTNIDELDEIIERPLFSSTRRQQQEEEIIVKQQAATHKPVKKPDLKLLGIVLSDDGKVALIKSRKNPKLQRVKLNEFISGWKLIELKPRSAKLESGSQSFTLEMQRKKGRTRTQTKTSSNKKTVPANPRNDFKEPSEEEEDDDE